MAQLTEGEKEQFKAQGLWVKERCDNAEGQCKKAIGFLAWMGKSGKTYCSEACRDQQEGTHTVYRKPRVKIDIDPLNPAGDFNAIEQEVFKRLKKEVMGITKLKDLLAGQGVGRRQDIRQVVLNLIAAKKLELKDRGLRIIANSVTMASTSSSKRGGEDRAGGDRPSSGNAAKAVRMRDVPVEDGQ